MKGIGDVLIQIAVALVIALLALRLTIGRMSFPVLRRRRTRRIVAIGVGGAGSNAVDAMLRARIKGVEFIACNTDVQALRRSHARRKVQIGHRATGGLGSGGDPAVGRLAAEEDAARISSAVGGASLLFIAAGLGGGTGSGAAPVIAEIARERGALTIAVVTLPFSFEGERRAEIAAKAAAEIGSIVNTIITISNDRLHAVAPETATLLDAFDVADSVLRQAVDTITRLISVPGLVNLDFADLRTILADGGPAVFGVGRSRGDERAIEAARMALSSPLLERGVAGARAVLFNIAGPADLRLAEVRGAADEIRASTDPGANVIFGATIDRRLRDEVQVTVIATALDVVPGAERGQESVPADAELAPLPTTADPRESSRVNDGGSPNRPRKRHGPPATHPALDP
jgi:cell division protein FtsZ